jgi:hypothetical protein
MSVAGPSCGRPKELSTAVCGCSASFASLSVAAWPHPRLSSVNSLGPGILLADRHPPPHRWAVTRRISRVGVASEVSPCLPLPPSASAPTSTAVTRSSRPPLLPTTSPTSSSLSRSCSSPTPALGKKVRGSSRLHHQGAWHCLTLGPRAARRRPGSDGKLDLGIPFSCIETASDEWSGTSISFYTWNQTREKCTEWWRMGLRMAWAGQPISPYMFTNYIGLSHYFIQLNLYFQVSNN